MVSFKAEICQWPILFASKVKFQFFFRAPEVSTFCFFSFQQQHLTEISVLCHNEMHSSNMHNYSRFISQHAMLWNFTKLSYLKSKWWAPPSIVIAWISAFGGRNTWNKSIKRIVLKTYTGKLQTQIFHDIMLNIQIWYQRLDGKTDINLLFLETSINKTPKILMKM